MWTKYRVMGDSHICSLCCQRSSLDWKDEASPSPACSQEHKLVLVPTYGGPLAGTTYVDFPCGCLPFPQQGIWDQKYRLYNSTTYFLPTVQTTRHPSTSGRFHQAGSHKAQTQKQGHSWCLSEGEMSNNCGHALFVHYYLVWFGLVLYKIVLLYSPDWLSMGHRLTWKFPPSIVYS